MHKLGIGVLFCFFAILGAAPGWAEDRDLRTVLEGRYAALKAAMAARNETAIASLLSPDFASEDVSGKVENASQMIGKYRLDVPFFLGYCDFNSLGKTASWPRN